MGLKSSSTRRLYLSIIWRGALSAERLEKCIPFCTCGFLIGVKVPIVFEHEPPVLHFSNILKMKVLTCVQDMTVRMFAFASGFRPYLEILTRYFNRYAQSSRVTCWGNVTFIMLL